MKAAIARMASHRPTLYDNWPANAGPEKDLDDDEICGLTETKKLRLQIVLAVNPLGVPSLAFCDAYKKMFGRTLDIESLGFKHLGEMVASLPEIFTVQDPNSSTALLFKDYPRDMILHDARLGLDFEDPNLDGEELADGRKDPNDLINAAWLTRDEDFPPDVVLPGEQYADLILPLTSANVPGSRGLHKALIVGATHPGRVYINIKSDSFSKIDSLSAAVHQYFERSDYPIEAYSVPEQFIYQGFPCLIYQPKGNFWERGEIVGRGFGDCNKILVKTVDYGEEFAVNPIYLYLMPRQFFDIPRQGVSVVLMGLKPIGSKWSSATGKRIRCFSNRDYWLDCLLIDVKKTQAKDVSKGEIERPKSASDSGVASGDSPTPPKSEEKKGSSKRKDRPRKRRSRLSKQIDFEAIICDRHDTDLDIYLDEILTLETYTVVDTARMSEVTCFRQKMSAALANIPRPVNPLPLCMGQLGEEKSIKEETKEVESFAS